MKKSPESRRRAIRLLLEEQGSQTTQALAAHFDVSAMTLNRDLQALADAGLVEREHGMVRLPEPADEANRCAVCGRSAPARSVVSYRDAQGQMACTCCVHCAQHVAGMQAGLGPFWGVDFLSGATVDLDQAWLVKSSRVSQCCMPSLLVFGEERDARSFITGFGGEVVRFRDAEGEHHAAEPCC